MAMNLKDALQFRPAEIKTYHSKTYERISPTRTSFDGKGKTVLITAGATGIGYSISSSFAAAGISRIIILQRRESVLAVAKASLEEAYPGLKVETHAASQSDFHRITDIIRSVGPIDVLIPCAASAGGILKPASEISTEDMLDMYNTNVVGLFHLVREFLALPSTALGRKSVIHVSSNASQMTFAGGSGYGSSKAAANQLLQHFAADQPESNVKFYNLHPGAIRTALAAENVPEDALVWEDVKLPGDFAVWLTSPEATFLNGRFVWAEWDVDELIAMKGRLERDPSLLTITLAR